MPKADRKNPTRAKSSESRYSLMEFMRDLPDDDACLNYLWRTRYSEDGDHAECPKCKVLRPFKRYETSQKRHSWTCTACGQHLHPTAGTIFHKSATSLHLWFYGMYLMTSTRCGISAKQLERELGITYKTAWRMFTLIRNQVMVQTDAPLPGEVEMDEMFVGGRPRRSAVAKWQAMTPTQHRQAARAFSERKAKVFGMGERHGNVAAHVVPSIRQEAFIPYVVTRVLHATLIYADVAPRYAKALPDAGYGHREDQPRR